MCASPAGRSPGCRGRGQSPLGLRTPLGPSGQSSGCPAPGPPARSVAQLPQVWFPLCFSSNSLSKYGTSRETLESWVGMEAVTQLTTSQGSSVKINTPHLQASGRGWLLRDGVPAQRAGGALPFEGRGVCCRTVNFRAATCGLWQGLVLGPGRSVRLQPPRANHVWEWDTHSRIHSPGVSRRQLS